MDLILICSNFHVSEMSWLGLVVRRLISYIVSGRIQVRLSTSADLSPQKLKIVVYGHCLVTAAHIAAHLNAEIVLMVTVEC